MNFKVKGSIWTAIGSGFEGILSLQLKFHTINSFFHGLYSFDVSRSKALKPKI